MPRFRGFLRLSFSKPIKKVIHIASVSIFEPVIKKGVNIVQPMMNEAVRVGLTEFSETVLNKAVVPYGLPVWDGAIAIHRTAQAFKMKVKGENTLFLLYGVSAAFATGAFVCHSTRYVLLVVNCPGVVTAALHVGALTFSAMGDAAADVTPGLF